MVRAMRSEWLLVTRCASVFRAWTLTGRFCRKTHGPRDAERVAYSADLMISLSTILPLQC